MKKFLSVMFIILISPCFLILFSACSNAEVTGTYSLTEVYSEGKTYKVGETLNEKVLTKDTAKLTLNNDEKATAVYVDADNPNGIKGIWKKFENFISFKSTEMKAINIAFEINESKDLRLINNDNAVIKLSKDE